MGGVIVCESVIINAVSKEKTKTCEYCGAEFTYKHGNTKMCPECYGVITLGKDRHSKNDWGVGPLRDQEKYERAIRLNAIERAKKNDRIIGEGYAERQKQKTLELAGKIDTSMDQGQGNN